MKKIIYILISICITTNVIAQKAKNLLATDTSSFSFPKAVKKARYNIAVISPLYLDSFDLAKSLTNLPSYAIPGLDFYQGARLAADTLNSMNFTFNLFIFDSKSKYIPVKLLTTTDKLDSMDVIIGNVGGEDVKLLAEFAKAHKINFYSAVSPSDADQKNNGYFTMLQPKLQTHVERIAKKITNSFSTSNIIYTHRGMQNELNAFSYFKKEIGNKLTNPMAEVIVSDLGFEEQIKNKLDKNNQNILVMGLLDAKVAYNYLKIVNLYLLEGYSIKVYGMPTWENIKAFQQETEFPELEIAYTSPMMVEKNLTGSQYIINSYKAKMGGNPTDNVYKGFEAVYYTAHMLNRYGAPFNGNYGEPNSSYNFLIPYRIGTAKISNDDQLFENKFLYFIKYKNGVMGFE